MRLGTGGRSIGGAVARSVACSEPAGPCSGTGFCTVIGRLDATVLGAVYGGPSSVCAHGASGTTGTLEKRNPVIAVSPGQPTTHGPLTRVFSVHLRKI